MDNNIKSRLIRATSPTLPIDGQMCEMPNDMTDQIDVFGGIGTYFRDERRLSVLGARTGLFNRRSPRVLLTTALTAATSAKVPKMSSRCSNKTPLLPGPTTTKPPLRDHSPVPFVVILWHAIRLPRGRNKRDMV
jgi:hypothetical protein